MCGGLAELLEAMEGCTARFDPALLGAGVPEAMKQAAAIENMAATIKAMAASWVADTGVWRREGDRSAAHHLARTTGTSVGQAVDAIETARRLESLPEVAALARRGELSTAQSSVIALAAAADPSAQSQLVARAQKSSLAELREECARVRAAVEVDPEARRARIHHERYLRSYTDTEGAWNLRVRNNPEVGAQFMAALAPFTDRRFHAARLESRREPVEAYAADALSEMAAVATAAADADGGVTTHANAKGASGGVRGGDASEVSGDSDSGDGDSCGVRGGGVRDNDNSSGVRGGDSGGGTTATVDAQGTRRHATADARSETTARPGYDTCGGRDEVTAPASGHASGTSNGVSAGRARRSRGSARAKIIVRVDLEALLRGYPASGETCELVGFGPVAVSAIRDMIDSGDPFLAAIATKGQDIVGVAHLGRRATALQQTALEWLYPECGVLGCSAQGHLEIDHRVDWAKTHVTLFDWLDGLCKHHHLLKTRDGWALVEGVGKRAFVPPHDPRHPRHSGNSPPRPG